MEDDTAKSKSSGSFERLKVAGTRGLCLRQPTISEGTCYAWKRKYGGVAVSEACRLRGLEDENTRLKFRPGLWPPLRRRPPKPNNRQNLSWNPAQKAGARHGGVGASEFTTKRSSPLIKLRPQARPMPVSFPTPIQDATPGQESFRNNLTVQLSGGLGNQMFQYAFGQAVAASSQARLLIDIQSGFVKDPYARTVAVTRLPIVADRGVPRLNPLARTAVKSRWPSCFVSLFQNWGFPRGDLVFREKQVFQYDQEVFAMSRPTYFIGYWQNPRYFDNVAHLVREQFEWKVTLSDYCCNLLQSIRNTCSVAIHVRKYNTADQKIFNAQRTDHLTLPTEYYQQGIGVTKQHVRRPNYFVFCDDSDENHLFLPRGEYTPINTRLVGDDLTEHWLMSQCKHHIIANSTFSWWAAWLNKNPAKCVVAPRRWFKNSLPSWNILPPEWTSISLDQ